MTATVRRQFDTFGQHAHGLLPAEAFKKRCDRDRSAYVQFITEATIGLWDSTGKSTDRIILRINPVKFTKVLGFGGAVTIAALAAVSPAMANCLPQQQAVVPISNPNSRIQRVTNINGTRTVVQQRTVAIPANRSF